MPTNSATMDRTSLVELLGVPLKTETPEARAVSVRVGEHLRVNRDYIDYYPYFDYVELYRLAYHREDRVNEDD